MSWELKVLKWQTPVAEETSLALEPNQLIKTATYSGRFSGLCEVTFTFFPVYCTTRGPLLNLRAAILDNISN